MVRDDERHIFNSDLLAHEDDIRNASALYKPVEDVLHHPDLVECFNRYDKRAGRAKKASRRSGIVALTLGGLALLLASFEILQALWRVAAADSSAVLPLFASLFGLASIAIGGFGLLLGARKQRWLHNRLAAERLRQFHFQSMILQFPQIARLLTAGPGANELKDTFRADRARLFQEFRTNLENNIAGLFSDLIGPYGEKQFWVSPADTRGSQPGAYAPNVVGLNVLLVGETGEGQTGRTQPEHLTVAVGSEMTSLDNTVALETDQLRGANALQSFFDAYLNLRIRHQLGHANYKLGNDQRLLSTLPVRQAQILDALTKFGIGLLAIVHAAVLALVVAHYIFTWRGSLQYQLEVAATDDGLRWISIAFAALIVAIAILGLVLRALQEGLQPEREIERYQQYRSAVQDILENFEAARTTPEKLEAMRQMERAAFDEMRNFLITSHRSSFVV